VVRFRAGCPVPINVWYSKITKECLLEGVPQSHHIQATTVHDKCDISFALMIATELTPSICHSRAYRMHMQAEAAAV